MRGEIPVLRPDGGWQLYGETGDQTNKAPVETETEIRGGVVQKGEGEGEV